MYKPNLFEKAASFAETNTQKAPEPEPAPTTTGTEPAPQPESESESTATITDECNNYITIKTCYRWS